VATASQAFLSKGRSFSTFAIGISSNNKLISAFSHRLGPLSLCCQSLYKSTSTKASPSFPGSAFGAISVWIEAPPIGVVYRFDQAMPNKPDSDRCPWHNSMQH
jgi:hypothetical protein